MKKGFTLIELLAVVLIMGVLTAIALPQYRKSVDRARVAEALQMLPAMYDARERLMTENNYNVKNPSDRNKVTFARLDIDFKGEADGSEWVTDSARYKLFSGAEGEFVQAQLQGSRLLKGTSIFYNGSSLSCCESQAGACDAFNIDKKSSCN